MRSIHGPMYVVDGIIKSVQRMKLKVEKDSFWESDKGQKLLTVVPPDAKDLEKQLLKGVPDAFKCAVYRKVVRSDTLQIFEKDYASAQSRTHGALVPTKPVPPTFGGKISYSGSLALNPQGTMTVEHVLCILAHDHPNLEFCPLIPPLCHLLAHFTTEPDDLLGLMVAIIKQNKEKSGDDSSISSSNGNKANKDISDRCFYFPTGNKEFLLFNRGFGNLIYKNYRKVHKHIVSLHKAAIKPLWDKWISDMFVNILPQRALWRLLDMYMASGYRALFQIGLALIDRFKNDILQMKTIAEFNDFFSTHSPALSTPKSLEDLFNSAAKMYIKKLDGTNLADHHQTLSNISTDDLVNMSSQRFQRGLPKFISSLVGGYNNKVDKSSGSSSPLSNRKKMPQDLLSTSTVIESDYWIALWSWIPPHKRMDSIELIFTTREHGTSISTLFQMTEGISPMILIIETTVGSVFGAYLSQPWQTGAAANGQFYGNGMNNTLWILQRYPKVLIELYVGESFLFILSPYAKLFPWVGRLEQDARRSTEELSENVTGYGTSLFVLTTQSTITIGGGGSSFGLCLEEMLVKGETGHCKTFDNDPLTGNKSTKFDIHTVEVFAFRE